MNIITHTLPITFTQFLELKEDAQARTGEWYAIVDRRRSNTLEFINHDRKQTINICPLKKVETAEGAVFSVMTPFCPVKLTTFEDLMNFIRQQ